MKENLYDDLYTEQEEQVDYKALFFKYLIHWKWFVASIVVCLIGRMDLSALYHTGVQHYRLCHYQRQQEKQQRRHRTGRFEDLGFYSSTSNFDNEVEVLHSRTLLKSSGGTGPVYQLQNPWEPPPCRALQRHTGKSVAHPEEAEKLPNGAAVLEVVLKPGGKLECQHGK